MANLWQLVDADKWAPTELHSAAVLGRESVDFGGTIRVAARRGAVLVYPNSSNTRAATWMLLASADSAVRINGALLENGIRVLADRDAIRVANLSARYFSTERLACIEAYPETEPVFCPRCKMMISKGDSAVCCPQCNVFHHEQVSEGRGCWSYAETCALCDQSSALESARFRWTPEEL
jgi:hypothetical protein